MVDSVALQSSAPASLAEAMSIVADSPAVQRLLNSPELLEQAKQRDPMLRQLLEQTPEMSSLLAPDKLRAVLDVVRDPRRLAQEGTTLLGDLDLTEQRKVRVMRMRHNVEYGAVPLPVWFQPWTQIKQGFGGVVRHRGVATNVSTELPNPMRP